MKKTFLLIYTSILFISSILAQDEPQVVETIDSNIELNAPSDNEIINRLKQLNLCTSNRFTQEVKGYINGYTIRKREKTEDMLTRTLIYFPIIEKYFNNSDLPKDLRNLAVVESALNPVAISKSGAMGLWQFMPETGYQYGLNISSYTDDRCDPHKSTISAIKLLKDLYRSFGDWELAIAAYNSGPNRITSAMKLARSNDFWRIRKYLPKETQNYVPAYIAANYILSFYQEHNLVRRQPNLDLQITNNLKVHNSISFAMLSSLTALPIEMIKQLNPTYSRDYIPSSTEGNNLVLPERVVSLFRDYQENSDVKQLGVIDFSNKIANPNSSEDPYGYYFKSIYVVDKNETIDDLAKLFHCSAENLMAWNNLTNSNISAGKELSIYLPKEMKRLKMGEKVMNEVEEEEDNIDLDNATVAKAENTNSTNFVDKTKKAKKKYLYYQIKRNETLSEIAEKYSGVSLKDLLRLNNIKNTKSVRAGKRIKLKEIE